MVPRCNLMQRLRELRSKEISRGVFEFVTPWSVPKGQNGDYRTVAEGSPIGRSHSRRPQMRPLCVQIDSERYLPAVFWLSREADSRVLAHDLITDRLCYQ